MIKAHKKDFWYYFRKLRSKHGEGMSEREREREREDIL